MDEKLEDLYKKAKAYWEDDGADPEDFDWELFAIEIEDLSNHKSDPIADHTIIILNRLYKYIGIRLIKVLAICTLIHPIIF